MGNSHEHHSPNDSPETPPSGIELAPGIFIDPQFLVMTAVRGSGPGGQNVNKVSTKAVLRINLRHIPLDFQSLVRLRRLAGSRLTAAGDIVINVGADRSLSRNKEEAIERLRDLVKRALIPPKPRVATKPTKSSQRRRVDDKKKRSSAKSMRRRPSDGD